MLQSNISGIFSRNKSVQREHAPLSDTNSWSSGVKLERLGVL